MIALEAKIDMIVKTNPFGARPRAAAAPAALVPATPAKAAASLIEGLRRLARNRGPR